MKKHPRQRRITLLQTLQNEGYFEFCRAVIDYAAQRRHWDLRGTISSSPFSFWEDLAWDELDGVIAINLDSQQADFAKGKGVATVSVSPEQLSPSLPQVTIDHFIVGRIGAEHLLERGFRSFAYIGDGSWGSERHRRGFETTIDAAGRTCLNRTIERGEARQLQRQFRGWLDAFPKPIGVMTQMDYLARYAAKAANDLGLRVPDDVGILGVNNNRWASILAGVPISSVEPDQRRFGQVAAKTLDTLMQGGTVEPTQYVPPLRVVTRQSTDTVRTQDQLVSQAMQYIRLRATEGISVDDVLAEVRCSRSTLDKRMKGAIGCTVHDAITRARVEKVKHMLLETTTTLEEIAQLCGFQYRASMYEAFKRVTGMTPGQYRRRTRP